jgi:hypothetical protein
LNTAIFAVYPTQASAEAALHALQEAGFETSDISVVAPGQQHAVPDVPMEKPPAESVSAEPVADAGPAPTLGVALGWLSNIGAIAVSGAMLMAAGPILLALRGVSDAVLGIADALMGFGFSADEAKKYEERVRGGAILLSIRAGDSAWIGKGKEVFERTGADEISSAYEFKGHEPVPELTHAEG